MYRKLGDYQLLPYLVMMSINYVLCQYEIQIETSGWMVLLENGIGYRLR